MRRRGWAAGLGVAGTTLLALALAALPDVAAPPRRAAPARAPLSEEGRALLRPLVVHQAPTGHTRVEFARAPEPGFAALAPFRLVLAVESDGAGGNQVAVSAYLRQRDGSFAGAAFAAPGGRRATLPAGAHAFELAVPLHPCFDPADLARLRLYVDPLGGVRIDARSLRIEPAAPAAQPPREVAGLLAAAS